MGSEAIGSDATYFEDHVYAERIRDAARMAGERGLAGLVVGVGDDLRYLLGVSPDSHERLTALVVGADGATAIVIPALEAPALRGEPVNGVGARLLTWVDGDDPYALVVEALGLEGDAASGPVGVDDELTARHLLPLLDRLPGGVVAATPVLRELRMIKSPAEADALRRAGAAIDRVHARMAEFLAVGRTEREAGELISAAILEEGHVAVDFVIVGSGPNGADPHHGVSDRVVEAGDVVVVDIGGTGPEGYHSDSTRTYVMGAADPADADLVAVLERAQAAGVDAVRPGVTAASVDAAARGVLEAAGLGEFFIHRTGHGIGVSLHEEPFIVAGNDLVLRQGMAFSVEPGFYLPGRWGARIEDIVIVTADGCESVNNEPHGLTVIPAP